MSSWSSGSMSSFRMSRSRRMSFTFASPSAAPASALSARVDVPVCRSGMPAGVNPEPAHQMRVLELHDLDRKSDHPAVDGGVSAVPVGIDGHVGGVAVLMLAVLRRALHPAIMIGS